MPRWHPRPAQRTAPPILPELRRFRTRCFGISAPPVRNASAGSTRCRRVEGGGEGARLPSTAASFGYRAATKTGAEWRCEWVQVLLNVPDGIRTGATGLKGQRPEPLPTGIGDPRTGVTHLKLLAREKLDGPG